MLGFCMFIRQAAIGILSYALVRRHNGARREKSEEDKYRDEVMKVGRGATRLTNVDAANLDDHLNRKR